MISTIDVTKYNGESPVIARTYKRSVRFFGREFEHKNQVGEEEHRRIGPPLWMTGTALNDDLFRCRSSFQCFMKLLTEGICQSQIHGAKIREERSVNQRVVRIDDDVFGAKLAQDSTRIIR